MHNRTAGAIWTTQPTVPPVGIEAAMDFVRLPGAGDSTLGAILVAATDAVINYLGLDLLEREWTLVHWDWPSVGTRSAAGLSRQLGGLAVEIPLPYARSADVLSVFTYGAPRTDFISRGNAIIISGGSRHGGLDGEPALSVSYRAGFGAEPEAVPAQIRQAVLMLAAWLYEHRGECDAASGLSRSGAASLLTPWRRAEVLP